MVAGVTDETAAETTTEDGLLDEFREAFEAFRNTPDHLTAEQGEAGARVWAALLACHEGGVSMSAVSRVLDAHFMETVKKAMRLYSELR